MVTFSSFKKSLILKSNSFNVLKETNSSSRYMHHTLNKLNSIGTKKLYSKDKQEILNSRIKLYRLHSQL